LALQAGLRLGPVGLQNHSKSLLQKAALPLTSIKGLIMKIILNGRTILYNKNNYYKWTHYTMKKILAYTTFLLLSSFSMAEGQKAKPESKITLAEAHAAMAASQAAMAENVSPYVKVVEIWTIVDGNAYFVVDQADALCGTNVLRIQISNTGSQATYSTLLSAAHAGKKVKLNMWKPCPDPGWGAIVEGVKVQF
jgi:hypothetical protein